LAVSINNEGEVKMKEIKKHNILLLFVLFIASTLMIVSVADAAFSIRLEKDAQISELPGGTLPTNVTFEIYGSETATTAIATQTFPVLDLVVDLPLNWIPGNNYVLRMKADFTNIDALTMDMDLWVDMKFDGTLVGTREKLKNEAWALFSVESYVAETVINDGVSTDMISDDAVTTEKILDNTVSSADAGFNYAGSDSKGGPAIDLDCAGCVSQSELDFTTGDDGDWTISGNDMYSSVSGKVGIGISNPVRMLHLEGNNPELEFRDKQRTNNGWHIGQMTNNFQVVETNIAERLTVEAGGNVGIGTTIPTEKLTVAGTIESTSGGIKFPDGTVQTSASASTWHQKLQCDTAACPRFKLIWPIFVSPLPPYFIEVAVLDNETGLVWERQPNTGIMDWYTARIWCRSNSTGNRKGWHLPTYEQLATLLDIEQSDPALPEGHPFIIEFDIPYWTATTADSFNGPATLKVLIDLHHGEEKQQPASGPPESRAWCVRGGQSYDGFPSYMY
jgi:hypothetical protein